MPHPSQEPLRTRGSCTFYSSDNLLGSGVRDAHECPKPLTMMEAEDAERPGQAWAGVLLPSYSLLGRHMGPLAGLCPGQWLNRLPEGPGGYF